MSSERRSQQLERWWWEVLLDRFDRWLAEREWKKVREWVEATLEDDKVEEVLEFERWLAEMLSERRVFVQRSPSQGRRSPFEERGSQPDEDPQ